MFAQQKSPLTHFTSWLRNLWSLPEAVLNCWSSAASELQRSRKRSRKQCRRVAWSFEPTTTRWPLSSSTQAVAAVSVDPQRTFRRRTRQKHPRRENGSHSGILGRNDRPRTATLDNTMRIGRPASLGNTLTRECWRGLSLRGTLRYFVISVFPDLTEPMGLAAILTIRDGATQEHAKKIQ